MCLCVGTLSLSRESSPESRGTNYSGDLVRKADGTFITVVKSAGTSAQCDKALILGQQYKWAVRARNGDGPGPLSAYVLFTPEP